MNKNEMVGTVKEVIEGIKQLGPIGEIGLTETAKYIHTKAIASSVQFGVFFLIFTLLILFCTKKLTEGRRRTLQEDASSDVSFDSFLIGAFYAIWTFVMLQFSFGCGEIIAKINHPIGYLIIDRLN